MDIVKYHIGNTIENLKCLLLDELSIKKIADASDLIIDALKFGKKLMICGNGGSAADAQHMAGEFVCRFYKDRKPLPAIALTTDTSIMTAISNDYSYDQVFVRQIIAIGKAGDVLLGITTSGKSRNILEAFKVASEMGIKTILLTGDYGRTIAPFSDIIIQTPASATPRIQEMHLIIEHIICELVEEECFNNTK